MSMGLGPIMAIYQARFNQLPDRSRHQGHCRSKHVWAFLGDGECDEPESLGAITLACARKARQPDLRDQLQPAAARRSGARQRQDHPRARRRLPRRRLERHQGRLGRRLGSAAGRTTKPACSLKRMRRSRRRPVSEVRRRAGGDYIREHFFGKYPELLEMVTNFSDEKLAEADARRPRSGEGLRRLQGRRRNARAGRPSSWPRRSRATAWAKRAKAATSRTNRRSSTKTNCASSAPRFGIPISDERRRRGAVLHVRPTTAPK